MPNRVSKVPLILGIVFVILAGVGAFIAISRAQNNEDIMVAKKDIAAYSFVGPDQLQAQGVAKSSVTSNDLTKKEFEDMNSKAVVTGPFLADQRIDKRYIVKGQETSFAGVLPDERVVAASATVTGAAVGTIQAGDVVDASVEGGGSLVDFAKVLCIATEPSGCKALLPAGVKLNASDNSDGNSDSKSVLLLFAVPADLASEIAGKSVTLSLNPFCRVDNKGFFYSPQGQDGFQCQAPGGRDASRRDKFSGQDEEESSSGGSEG
jgi:hypothetical protein